MPIFVPDGAKDSAVHTLNRRKRPRRRHHLVLLVLPHDTRCGHDEDVCRVADARRRRHGAAVKEARVPRNGREFQSDIAGVGVWCRSWRWCCCWSCCGVVLRSTPRPVKCRHANKCSSTLEGGSTAQPCTCFCASSHSAQAGAAPELPGDL